MLNSKQMKKLISEKLNIPTKCLSVTIEHGTTRVTIKLIANEIYSLEAVTEIASCNAKIDRCEYSNEILSGGNNFVFCNYSLLDISETNKIILNKIFQNAIGRCSYVNCNHCDFDLRRLTCSVAYLICRDLKMSLTESDICNLWCNYATHETTLYLLDTRNRQIAGAL